MASLSSILGARISVTNDAGESFEGDLFAYDEKSHTVVLASQDKHDQQHATLKMIRETAITDLRVRKIPAPASAYSRDGIHLRSTWE